MIFSAVSKRWRARAAAELTDRTGRSIMLSIAALLVCALGTLGLSILTDPEKAFLSGKTDYEIRGEDFKPVMILQRTFVD